jgi:predicted nucleic acid-binding protein
MSPPQARAEFKEPLQVFADTGVLLAMILFPKDRRGHRTLAGEVLELYEAGRFELTLSEPVVEELRRVVQRKFPKHLGKVEAFLAPFKGRFTRWPTLKEVEAAQPATADPTDAPIFATAIAAEPKPDIMLSNDFTAFHTDRAKRFFTEHSLEVESLYGLLCLFGLRERRADRA